MCTKSIYKKYRNIFSTPILVGIQCVFYCIMMGNHLQKNMLLLKEFPVLENNTMAAGRQRDDDCVVDEITNLKAKFALLR